MLLIEKNKPALRPARTRRPDRSSGFILIEVMVAVILLAMAIGPMLSAFAPAVRSAGAAEASAVFANRTRATLNRVAALDFAVISDHAGDPADLAGLFGSQAEADQETFMFRGTAYTPRVVIADASGGAGNLLELAVSCEAVSFKTLRSND